MTIMYKSGFIRGISYSMQRPPAVRTNVFFSASSVIPPAQLVVHLLYVVFDIRLNLYYEYKGMCGHFKYIQIIIIRFFFVSIISKLIE